MSKHIDIVLYEEGDKVKYISPIDLPLREGQVDTRAELTVVGTEMREYPSITFQICDITDGKNVSFANSIELKPSDPEEMKAWIAAKKRAEGMQTPKRRRKTSTSSNPKKPKSEPNVSMLAGALKGKSIKKS